VSDMGELSQRHFADPIECALHKFRRPDFLLPCRSDQNGPRKQCRHWVSKTEVTALKFDFRCYPNNGHAATASAGPFRVPQTDSCAAAIIALFNHQIGCRHQAVGNTGIQQPSRS
jgi:hypothetical protein